MSTLTISHIVAVAANGVIGSKNQLPWRIPEDLKFFREKTKGHIMVVGRKTFESLGRVLPERFHIVVTSQKDFHSPSPLVVGVGSLQEAFECAKKLVGTPIGEGPLCWPEEIFVIGGGEIYKQSMPIVDKIYLTRIEAEFNGDTRYPNPAECGFTLVSETLGGAASGGTHPTCRFQVFKR